jgi:hypothetical protein
MTAVKYVSAIIRFGLGVALAFAAVQSMYSSLGLGDNPGGPIVAGVGAMFLLVTIFAVAPKNRSAEQFRYKATCKDVVGLDDTVKSVESGLNR